MPSLTDLNFMYWCCGYKQLINQCCVFGQVELYKPSRPKPIGERQFTAVLKPSEDERHVRIVMVVTSSLRGMSCEQIQLPVKSLLVPSVDQLHAAV